MMCFDRYTMTALQGGTITSPSQNASVPFEIPLAALAGPIIAGERGIFLKS